MIEKARFKIECVLSGKVWECEMLKPDDDIPYIRLVEDNRIIVMGDYVILEEIICDMIHRITDSLIKGKGD